MKYKSNTIIEAIQWTNSPNNFTEILEWSNGLVKSASPLIWEKQGDVSLCLEVPTWGGTMLARLNDYIIKDASGRFDYCSPDYFEQNYEKV